MKRRAALPIWGFCLIVLAMSAATALAQTPTPAQPQPPADPAKTSVKVTRAECQMLTQHRPAPGVAYQPGVDATGRPVVPADLAPGPSALSDGVVIDLILPFSSVVPAAPGLARSETKVGRIRIDPNDGRAWLDGRLLDDPSAHAIAQACAQAFSAKP